MTTEIAVVLGLALVAIVLFATEKLRIDAIALLVLSTLEAVSRGDGVSVVARASSEPASRAAPNDTNHMIAK